MDFLNNIIKKNEDTRADQLTRDDRLCQKFIDIHTFKVESLKKLNGRLPADGEIFFLWTLNSFNAFTFIPYIIKELGYIESLIFSTYSINSRIVHAFSRWINKGLIGRVHIYISDSIKHRLPAVVDLLEGLSVNSGGKMTIKYAWNHSKVTLIESGGNFFVVEGSGNFSENAQVEQYVFLNNKSVFDFRKGFIS